MMSCAIEALYIFDANNQPILKHIYRGRPASPLTILPFYLAHPKPRPSVLYIESVNPATTLFSVDHANLVLCVPNSKETEALFVLEFLHRFIDALEEFLGAPLQASKIEGSYDIVAQLLGEMCDAGIVCNTEPNALRDVVDMPGWMDKLLGGVGIPGPSPGIQTPGGFRNQLALTPVSNSPAIPWRSANIRHTSSELYVDIVESIVITLAPSGRPLAAFAHGSVLFTSKISGVPDLLLVLSAPGGHHTIDKVLELPVFHPCVRLARWRERSGELSFVPPDGRFLLAGYEVNLLPSIDYTSKSSSRLNLPASIEMSKSLGPTGCDFEARIILSSTFAGTSISGSRSGGPGRSSGSSTPSIFGNNSAGQIPSLRDVVVTIPIPEAVRNITDVRTSRGEAHYAPAEHEIEWRLSTKDASVGGSATLRCTVVGPLSDKQADDGTGFGFGTSNGDYDENEAAYQAAPQQMTKEAGKEEQRDLKKVEQNSAYMPSSASLSFSVKGWLASGIRVESLNIDMRKSRGIGESVKLVKGAKYLTVSKRGVETRC